MTAPIDDNCAAGEVRFIATCLDGDDLILHYGCVSEGAQVTTACSCLAFYSDCDVWATDLAKRGIVPWNTTDDCPDVGDMSCDVSMSPADFVTDITTTENPAKRVISI